ncbi:hypothetical protein PFISCL1PPCAC_8513 [Pristionchus fissidentatus]|uniref:Uncharacterized protein n=1 Tax=Pristionchus fissidentatus TaxID=1538716 RepID=A0AAV5VCU1_9BILA|nr:hypothetical protein PFISCL1PPCAC_8513 [Pristionchus fissidentatus]
MALFKVFPKIIFGKLLCNLVWLCYLIGNLSLGPKMIVFILLRAIFMSCDVPIYSRFMQLKKGLEPLYAEARALKKGIESEKKKTREVKV